jgi:hypothetical protein
MLKKYLLSSVAFAPDGPAGGNGDTADDERIDVNLEDDEQVTDPVEDEVDGADADDPDNADDADVHADDGEREPAAPRTRGDRQFAELRERNRLLAEQNATVTRQLDEMRRNPPQPQHVEDPRVEAERVALMSPEERIQYTVDKSLRQHQQKSDQLMHQLMDQSDRSSFEAKAAANPVAKKLAGEVERRLADLRSRGQNLPRDVVFTYLVGERALAQMGKGKTGARERQQRQQARPSNARGDAATGQRVRRDNNDLAAMERRLENQPI